MPLFKKISRDSLRVLNAKYFGKRLVTLLLRIRFVLSDHYVINLQTLGAAGNSRLH